MSGSSEDTTTAALARLEAIATLEASKISDDVQIALTDGWSVAYSSTLAVATIAEAQSTLAKIFTQALAKTPPRQIGGCLFYDEQSCAVVQVLEGPAAEVKSLYQTIQADPRHTSIKTLWERPINTRHYHQGFGMQLGSDPASVLNDGDSEAPLLHLTYGSEMTAASVVRLPEVELRPFAPSCHVAAK